MGARVQGPRRPSHAPPQLNDEDVAGNTHILANGLHGKASVELTYGSLMLGSTGDLLETPQESRAPAPAQQPADQLPPPSQSGTSPVDKTLPTTPEFVSSKRAPPAPSPAGSTADCAHARSHASYAQPAVETPSQTPDSAVQQKRHSSFASPQSSGRKRIRQGLASPLRNQMSARSRLPPKCAPSSIPLHCCQEKLPLCLHLYHQSALLSICTISLVHIAHTTRNASLQIPFPFPYHWNSFGHNHREPQRVPKLYQ
jgi:hypothetical protein